MEWKKEGSESENQKIIIIVQGEQTFRVISK